MELQNLEHRIEHALNPSTNNNLYKNKKKKSEQQQHIPEIEINENGEMMTYSLGDMKITKHVANNMYTLDSVHNLISSIQLRSIVLFLSSSRFQYILQTHDKEFEKYQFVYYIQFENYVKIGQTFDIKKRYQPKDINEKVKRLIFVKNVNDCEKRLIRNFSKIYNTVKGREGFDITSQNDINESLKLFDSTVEEYKIDVTNIKDNHVNQYRKDKIFGTGYYLSPLATSIVLNTFGKTDYKYCKLFIKTIEVMDNKFNKSDYISTFEESSNTFFYWKFHGYTVIVNIDKNLINASRLWNTILKAQGKDKKDYPFTNFIKRNHIKEIFKNNPETKPVKFNYRNRPLLNGRYMPIVFTHFILEHLDTKYSYEVAKLMTESLFEKAKREATKKQKTTDSSTITGGDILQLKKVRTINRLLKILNRSKLRI